ncbi:MAG: peptidoglycan-binding protein, partial [Pseudomonadota bacterium]
MKALAVVMATLVAGSVLTTPASSAQRKTLFEVLFPKAHEHRLKREQARQEELRKKLALEELKKRKPVRVATSRFYNYRVPKRATLKIEPKKWEVAAVASVASQTVPSDELETQAVSNLKQSQMTTDLLSESMPKLAAEEYVIKALNEYYSSQQNYFWLNEHGEWNAKARSVFKLLENSGDFGMDANDYKVSKPQTNVVENDSENTGQSSQAHDRVHMELSMSIVVLRYAMDAKFGRINPNRLSGYHDFPVHYEKAQSVFSSVMEHALPANVLRGMHPENQKFLALKRELGSLSVDQDEIIDLPVKVIIRPGNAHESLPEFVSAIGKRGSDKLKSDFQEILSGYDGGTQYSNELAALVKAYQKEAGLGADGVIGPNTASKLAGIKPETKERQLVLAMERMRWLPHELGERHVFINQPEYRARYIEAGSEALSMRVVVGKKSNQTNFFYDEIEHIVYNPYWGV